MTRKAGWKYCRNGEWGRKSRKYDDQLGKGSSKAKDEVKAAFEEALEELAEEAKVLGLDKKLKETN